MWCRFEIAAVLTPEIFSGVGGERERVAVRATGVLAALTYAAPAYAGDQDFKLINKTGYDITEVYVSPSNDNEWGDDVMGKDTLDNGESVDISFSHNQDACHWDLKVVYIDKDEAIWHDINLCKVSKITIHRDKKSRDTTATTE